MNDALAGFNMLIGWFFSMAGCLLIAIQAVKVIWITIVNSAREIQEASRGTKPGTTEVSQTGTVSH